MNKKSGILILCVAATAVAICGTCAIVVGAVALGAGPDGIDLRPTPNGIAPEEALSAEVGGYERGECYPVTEFRGVDLGPQAVEATYIGSRGSARVVAARWEGYQEAARAVSDLADQLERVGSLGSHRLMAEEPVEVWWSASSKRSFVRWHAPAWGMDRHGLVWQSGTWCFIVASSDPVARRDVALDFRY